MQLDTCNLHIALLSVSIPFLFVGEIEETNGFGFVKKGISIQILQVFLRLPAVMSCSHYSN